jgi:hypothetical protein
MDLNEAPFQPIRVEWISYCQWRQVEASAGPPGATGSWDSKPPATTFERRRMSDMVILYIVCGVLAIALAVACVVW